jgi:hypothetical protein
MMCLLLQRKEVKILNKKIIITALAIATLGAGILTSSKVFAQTTPSGNNPMSTLIQKIATKFGLNTSDVQAVFDQDRTDQEAQQETDYEARLTQAVTDGKITEAQKQLILTKHKELEASRQNQMQNMQGKTDTERKAAMESERTALETWAKENNIDMSYLMGGRGMGHRGGPKGMGPPSTQ